MTTTQLQRQFLQSSSCGDRGSRPVPSTAFHVVIAGMTLIALLVATETTQAQQAKKSPPVQRTLEAIDGWPIQITYYASTEQQNAPVVVLLHMEGSNQLVWTTPKGRSFADQLSDQGFAVVAVDLRKHGLSKQGSGGGAAPRGRISLKPNDYRGMVQGDLEAVWKFLFDEHQAKRLNMRKAAIVAAQMSGPIAINFAATDWAKAPYDDAPVLASRTPQGQTVQALALFSPESSVPGMTTAKAMSFLKNLNIAWFFAVGVADSFDDGATEKLYKQVSGGDADSRTYFDQYKTKLRGTQLVGNGLPGEKRLMDFLMKHVKSLDYPWQDRRPAYNRSE